MAPENRKHSQLRLVFRELVLPFWTRSEERWTAWGLLLATVAFIFVMVYSLVLLNHWNQAFYDALQKLDRDEFVRQLWRFFVFAFAYALAAAFKFFCLQSLAVRWRAWMTQKNLNRWLHHKNYYQWQLTPQENDNPDQRLSEDIFELSDLSLEIGEKIFREVITFVSFIGILWGLSGSIHFQAFGWNVELHRYLVVICLAYAVLGTWLVHRVGNPLAPLHFLQQRFEADFRFLLVRLRENAESIALSRGEPAEKENLFAKFGAIFRNYKQIIARQRDVILTSSAYGQFAYVFPFVVASPKVFTREITLGQLFQISSAFGQVQGSVSVFIDLYPKIARWYSVVMRLGGFLEALETNEDLRSRVFGSDGLAGESRHGDSRARVLSDTVPRPRDTIPVFTSPEFMSSATALKVRDLVVQSPDGRSLIEPFNLELRAGERVLVTAPSGSGKSTFVRTITKLWPYFHGDMAVRDDMRTLALTQNPYFPMSSLMSVLSYPESASNIEATSYEQALNTVGLGFLIQELQSEAHWSHRLSTGERQRLSLARALVQKPNLLILDEATSALGSEMEAMMLAKICDELPGATILSLAPVKNPAVADFYTRTVSMSPAK